MLRLLKIGALTLLVSVVGAVQASATTIMDPIVRTRSGTGGSIPITGLPFFFDWGAFPGLPPGFDPPDCFTDTIDGMPAVTCEFVNQTGQAIQFLDFNFDYTNVPGGPPPIEEFQIIDEDGLFTTLTIDQFGAQFIGGGILPEECVGEIEVICFGGHFFVDLIGFPDQTRVTMAAAAAVPEPMTLTLLATGLALGAGARHRRRK
jgi:hypothetical protein